MTEQQQSAGAQQSAMVVTAKFQVQSVKHVSWNRMARIVELQAVSGDENKPWSQYTPSGTITMQIDNPPAAAAFELGRTFLLTFEPTAP